MVVNKECVVDSATVVTQRLSSTKVGSRHLGGGCGCCQKSVATRDIGAEKCCGCCFADGGSAEAMQLAEPAMVIGAVAAVGLATWVCTKKCKRNTDGHAPVKVPPQQEEMAFLE